MSKRKVRARPLARPRVLPSRVEAYLSLERLYCYPDAVQLEAMVAAWEIMTPGERELALGEFQRSFPRAVVAEATGRHG